MIELSKFINKQFVFNCLNMLDKAGKLTEKNNNFLLSNRDYCSRKFLCPFAILSEVPTLGKL